MIRKLFFIMICALCFASIPVAAGAVEQETIDLFYFLLGQSEWDDWDNETFAPQDLVDGLGQIYADAVQAENEEMQIVVLTAMGRTRLPDFVPTLSDAVELDPSIVCGALSRIPSGEGVDVIISQINCEDDVERGGAIWALGAFEYYPDFPDERQAALSALHQRLTIETVPWVIDRILTALQMIYDTY